MTRTESAKDPARRLTSEPTRRPARQALTTLFQQTRTPTGVWRRRARTGATRASLPTLRHEPQQGIAIRRRGSVETITVRARTFKPLFLTTSFTSGHDWRVRIIVEADANARLIHDVRTNGRQGRLSLEITMAEKSVLCHTIVQHGGALRVVTSSRIERGARLDRSLLSSGETILEEEDLLAGEDAQATSSQLYLAPATSRVEIIHAAPGTRSVLHSRGISRQEMILEGTLRISPAAQGSDARQELHALLATPTASAKTSPRLFIGTGEVTCTHAATTSRYDQEQAYYLKSRGLDEQETKRLLLRAFATRILQEDARLSLLPFLEQLLREAAGEAAGEVAP